MDLRNTPARALQFLTYVFSTEPSTEQIKWLGCIFIFWSSGKILFLLWYLCCEWDTGSDEQVRIWLLYDKNRQIQFHCWGFIWQLSSLPFIVNKLWPVCSVYPHFLLYTSFGSRLVGTIYVTFFIISGRSGLVWIHRYLILQLQTM